MTTTTAAPIRELAGTTPRTATQPVLRGVGARGRERATFAASAAMRREFADQVITLLVAGGWEASEPVDAHDQPRAQAAARSGNVLVQPHTDGLDTGVFLAEVNLARDDPWSMPSFWKVEHDELARLDVDLRGATRLTPHSHSLAYTARNGHPDAVEVADAIHG